METSSQNVCETDQDFNETHNPETLGLCLSRLLDQIVENYEHKTAIISGDKTLTYRELNTLATRFARELIHRGIGDGDLVGVALDRSVDLIPVFLAVWKTGAAYVPIDPELPSERIRQMMEDASLRLVITCNSSYAAFGSRKDVCLDISDLLRTIHHETKGISLGLATRSDDLAYVMYTSGSTGRPKGVEVTHGSVSNLLLSLKREPGCAESDRLLAITTVSFDMAVVELFLPLLCGATLVIAQGPDIKEMAALVTLLRRHKITIMQGTPAIWQMLLDSGWQGQPRLKKVFCGGEALSRQLADRLLACGDVLWNMYGPTEATVYGSIWNVSRGQNIIVGRPITNGHLYVLDENQAPVPLGQPGELYIGGAGVARGYRNMKELTRSRFLDNPFHGGTMYRTGDLARMVTSGCLSVIGRIDGQVKIRGYRIELSDIEAAILEHEDISGAVVITHDGWLVAYCILKAKSGSVAARAKTGIDRELRLWLATKIPTYMIPAFFVEMEAFPVTINGKVNRKALPDPIKAIKTTGIVKPATEIEDQIRGIWSRALNHDRFGVHDSFFEVGGDSLRIVHVQRELQDLLGRSIASPKLFEHYTIKSLATYLSTSPDKVVSMDTKTQHQASTTEDIAIVSMACRLPGDITNPEDFWELLVRGGDAISDVPEDRWGGSGKDDSYCRQGGFIPSTNSFDISLFGISPKEARSLDPAQYLMLEICWEGFERAGLTMEKLRGSQTGVFVGTSNILAHQSLNQAAIRDLSDLDGYTVTGSAGGTMSGRIAYHFGLEGPALTIDTACSSSLVTTHLACNALRQGECDMAISGGVTLMLNPGLHVEFSRLQGMSPDGRCRAFSADTEGTGWSEGSAVVILKRLTDAQRDGDQIHAVIRGTAVNHDGRSASLTAPSGPAQQRLIQRALTVAGLQPNDIDYIEAHGTGTKLGDPIEATALAEVFGANRSGIEPLLIGSAKSNIGHTQAAAGLVGLLKVVLALQNSTLPESLHITKPTPAVDWQLANMTPVLEKSPWTSMGSRLRRAGISAFGIGGTNAHIIVEESSEPMVTAEESGAVAQLTPPTMPFCISGDTDAALEDQAERLHRYLIGLDQSRIQDVSYSLATMRTHLRRRLVLVAQTKAELLEKLGSIKRLEASAVPASDTIGPPRVAMLFTGQGSQWPGMGKGLCEVYPVFRNAIQEVATHFTNLEVPLLDVMWADPDTREAALLNRTDFAQPALFALEVALWKLWESWGVRPDFVLGHSLGELVAAHVAGIFDLSDACRLVMARSRLMQAQADIDTQMVSLGTTAAEVASAIVKLGHGAAVDIALYNTPRQTVISGKREAVESISDHFSNRGCKTKTLVVGHAFHSRFVDGMLEDFRAVAETLNFSAPNLSVISSLSGSVAKMGQMNQAEYWVRQAREPVRFSDSIKSLGQYGVDIFLELGPQPILCGMGTECLQDGRRSESFAWAPSLMRGRDGVLILQRSIANLHVRHVPINWTAYFEPFGSKRIDLPTYPFQRYYDARRGAKATHGLRNLGKASRNVLPRVEDGLQFELMWYPAKIEDMITGRTWGIMTQRSSPEKAEALRKIVSRTGNRLVDVDHLKDAEHLDGLICMWDSDEDVLSQVQDHVPKALAQLQTAAQTQFAPPLVWVTRLAIGTGTEPDDQNMNLGAAPLWGMMRTARSEHPELRLRLVDLAEETIHCVASALLSSAEPECAIRQGQVLAPRMERVRPLLNSIPKRPLLRRDGAVLITGGLGHLGARVARWLATNHGVHDMVLTSRRGMETPGADHLVNELATGGVKVTVLVNDTSDPLSIESIMAIFGKQRPLRGVVHAAGVADSGVLLAMTPERCATTLGPKACGAWVLHQATSNMDLDLFMMFSSISGVMGMPGLANYAAANSFLDALAHLRCAQGLPATSVAYGTWSGDGMASRLGHNTLSHLAHFGLDTIAPEEGLDLLEEAVVSTRALTIAAALDLRRLRNFVEEQGGIPPLLRLLLSHESAQVSQSWDLWRTLHETEQDQHSGIVLSMVREVVAKALGFTHPLDVDVDRSLQEIGIDSLTAVQMRNHLAKLTGLTLSVNIAMVHPNLRMLSQFLLSQLRETETSSSSTVSSSNTSVTTIFDLPRLDMASIRKGYLDSSFTFDNVSRDPIRCITRPQSVFLTGVTGFVGAFVLHELVRQGITTYCLVRADDVDKARERITMALEEYGLWEPEFATLIKAVVGDLSQPLLGLTEDCFNELADSVDAICHSGALVDWMRPLEEYVGPNIVSTHEILRLASYGCAKAVHLVSTISTLPIHLGFGLTEQDQEFGYGTSKYMAERLVTAARWRGAMTTIYRLPYVTASTTTGRFRVDRGDFLHNFFSGSLELGAFPSLAADMSAVLPVDYLSKTITAIMTQDLHRMGRDFDFVNARAQTCNGFFKLLSAFSGGKEIVAFNTWKQRALSRAVAHPAGALARIAAVLDNYTDETAPNMFKGLTVGEHVLGGEEYPAPLLGEHFIQAYLNQMGIET
uniref:Polyketide synthase n=1 Tax=Pestalotiopsis microspora TaxID=85828 RepID=A0A1P8NTH1_PESMI|nr:polyketide synthase [Pestalotiopsis microspora]